MNQISKMNLLPPAQGGWEYTATHSFFLHEKIPPELYCPGCQGPQCQLTCQGHSLILSLKRLWPKWCPPNTTLVVGERSHDPGRSPEKYFSFSQHYARFLVNFDKFLLKENTSKMELSLFWAQKQWQKLAKIVGNVLGTKVFCCPVLRAGTRILPKTTPKVSSNGGGGRPHPKPIYIHLSLPIQKG